MLNFLGISFHLYGLLAGLGIFVGAWVSAKIVQKEKMDPEIVWDSLVWMVVFGLIGARIYHVVDLWSYYSQNLGEIIAIWNGGIGIYGGLLGGFIGLNVWIYSRFFSNQKENYKLQIINYKKKLLMMLDLAAFGLPVGQAIGRWGNYLNQELYGQPTDLPWGIFIDLKNRTIGFEQYERFHPLFLYESILNLVLFSALVVIYVTKWQSNKVAKFKIGSGKFVGMYLVGYGLIRLMLESLRINNWKVGEAPVATLFSLAIIVCGLVLLKSKIKTQESK